VGGEVRLGVEVVVGVVADVDPEVEVVVGRSAVATRCRERHAALQARLRSW
jgi:hypothetical protein